jgi:hypothetical protein
MQNHKYAALVIALGAGFLAACVPPPAANPPPPEPEVEAATQVQEPEAHPLAPVDVRAITCGVLTSSSDDDKAYASSFLLGYRSALMHSHTIEIKRIEAVEEAALADCAGKPDALAGKIFAAALERIGPGGEIRTAPGTEARPVHRIRRREPPYQAMPGEAPTEQMPVEQAAPDQLPPMRYAPAQGVPVQAAPVQPAPVKEAPAQATPAQAPPQEAPAPSPPPPPAPPPPVASPPPPVASPPAPPPPAATPPASAPSSPAQPPTAPSSSDSPRQ